MSKSAKSSLDVEDRRLAKIHRESLSKHRHWISGFETGSGKAVPQSSALAAIIAFLDRIAGS